MDLAQACNAPEPFPLAGADYPVRSLTFGEWAPITVFIKTHHPGPVQRVAQAIADARRGGEPLDDDTVDQLLSHAHRQAQAWPPRHGSKEWFDALDSIEGADTEVLWTILSKTVDGYTRDQARTALDTSALTPDARLARILEYGAILRMGLYGERPIPKEKAASAPARPSKRQRKSRPSGTSGRRTSTRS